MLNTQLPDELDYAGLRLVYDWYKNGTVDKFALSLAAYNIEGYAIGLWATQPPLMQAANGMTEDAAFQALLNPPDEGMQKIGDGTLLKLIWPILLKILIGV